MQKIRQRKVLIEGPVDSTGKLRFHETSRPLGTDTYFSSCGDDISDASKVGGGDSCLKIRHAVGGGDSHSVYFDLNIASNETWLHEGYLSWLGFDGDMASLEIVNLPATTVAGTNTLYNLYGGYLVVPAAGDGTLDITSDLTDPRGGLVYMPDSDEGEPPLAYWNADWNPSTKQYENIAAAPTGDGRYNIFSLEIVLSRFVNKIALMGDGFMMLQSADTARLGQGMRLKLTVDRDTTVDDRVFSMTSIITFHRVRST